MENKTIFIVDDDVQIGNMEQELLEKNGYQCVRAYSGTEALLLLEKTRPDLVLLDLMLPGLSGEELLPKIMGIPVIVVSAKIGIEDKVSLLMDGAADYITKPFDTKELLARIAVQLRKVRTPSPVVMKHGDLSLNVATREVSVESTNVKLTKTEYAILKLLMQNEGRVVTKSAVLDEIFDDTPDCTESSLKTHISHLRAKLRQDGDKEYIESVWGIGFKLTDI